ncbi:MAG TPA: hypothetical protein PK760_08710, partial [Flavobacteriales bacterium]|nr:hypothetical protein [Flavobacteriales bacterium]
MVVVAVALAGCDSTKRVPEGSYLLKHNSVSVEGNAIPASELEVIIKQKPNKRILWVPFYLHAYNIPDPEKIPAAQAKRDAHIDAINARRKAKAKSADEPVKVKPYKLARGEWLRTKVGEAPVILDSALTKRTVDQMQLYMAKEGYFRSTASDSVRRTHRGLFSKSGRPFKKPKVEVDYYVHPGPMYRLRKIRFEVDDPAIRAQITSTWNESLLDSGDRVDDDALDAERVRITSQLRADGYL